MKYPLFADARLWHERGMSWIRYAFEEHRTHLVPQRLAAPMLHELTMRHGAVLRDHPAHPNGAEVSSWAIDLGGMWISGSPSEIVRLRGLEISVPCHHVAMVIEGLRRRAPEKLATGEIWYGLPHWHFALILLPAQYHALLAKLVACRDRAEERSAHFHAGRAKIRTVPVEMPDGSIRHGIVP